MSFGRSGLRVPSAEEALPGRTVPMAVTNRHFVLGRPLLPVPDEVDTAVFGLGCFWGAERRYWETEGVWVTAAGYAGGHTPNPTYEEVCSGGTGHAEVVLVEFDPGQVSYGEMLQIFWESHDPTQHMRQGNDLGTQYRSLIGCVNEAQRAAATASRDAYQEVLTSAGYGQIATEIVAVGTFYFAEDRHQQHLAKFPGAYCAIGGTGVSCPAGPGARPQRSGGVA